METQSLQNSDLLTFLTFFWCSSVVQTRLVLLTIYKEHLQQYESCCDVESSLIYVSASARHQTLGLWLHSHQIWTCSETAAFLFRFH